MIPEPVKGNGGKESAAVTFAAVVSQERGTVSKAGVHAGDDSPRMTHLG